MDVVNVGEGGVRARGTADDDEESPSEDHRSNEDEDDSFEQEDQRLDMYTYGWLQHGGGGKIVI